MRDMVARSADDIAASVKVLKAQLAAVDEKIVTAANDLQRATDGIAARLQMRNAICRRWGPK